MQRTPLSLLQRVADTADEEAWIRFVRLYTPFLYEWAGRLRLQPHDAADLVQDIFVTLVRVLPQFNYAADGSFRGWLYRLAINKWKDRRKMRSTAPLDVFTGHDPLIPDPLVEWTETDYRIHLTRRALDLLQQEFSVVNWQAFWATTMEGRAVADVARELGLTPNAIYQTRARIVRRLRGELDGIIDG